MKRFLTILLLCTAISPIAHAQIGPFGSVIGTPTLWKLNGTQIVPASSSWTVDISNNGVLSDTDADTYIDPEESADEDFIRMYTAGSQVLTIDSSGNVGIGVSSPGDSFVIARSLDSSRINLGWTNGLANFPTLKFYNENGVDAGEVTIQSLTDDTRRGLFFNAPGVGGALSNSDNFFTARFGGASNKFYVSDNGTSTYLQSGHQMYLYAGAGSVPDITLTPQVVLNSSGDLGIGISSPISKLHVVDTTEQLRIGYDASTYTSVSVASDGGVTVSPTGTDADFSIDFSGATDGDFNVASGSLFVDSSTGDASIGAAGTNGYALRVYETTNSNVLYLQSAGSNTVSIFMQSSDRSATLSTSTDAQGVQSTGFMVGRNAGSDHFKMRSGNFATIYGALGVDSSTNVRLQANSGGAGIVLLPNGSNGVGIGLSSPDTKLDVNGAITLRDLSADPSDPDSGAFTYWQSDGTDTGSDGDVLMKVTDSGGTTKTFQLFDFSSGGLGTGVIYKGYTFVARDASSGENFQAGFYDYSDTDANLSNAGTTVTHGGANAPYAAHAFLVAGAAGTTDGSDLVVTVTGTSISDDGTRTGSDSEVIVADATASTTDQYYETTKKWLGTVTYTLSSTGGSTYAYDFNYGYAKYEDFGNRDFTVTEFESVGLANANDSSFEIELLYHSSTGWTYAATGFQAGGTVITSMNTTHSTEQDIDAGEPFAFKRTGLSQSVTGSGLEGLIIRVTTGINNSVSYMDSHVGIVFD